MDITVHPPDEPGGGNRIEIGTFPDAAKIVRLPDNLGKRLAHLELHRQDLIWANQFLDECERQQGGQDNVEATIAGVAAWHAAVNTAMKCFGPSNARVRLDPAQIFGDETDDRAEFNFIKSLRDKNISHDDNDWSNAEPMAFLNHPDREPKILGVDCMTYGMASYGPGNVDRLRMVIARTFDWVAAEFDNEIATAKAELESWDYESLAALPEPGGSWPTGESVHRNRGK